MASKQNYSELKRNTIIIGISNLGSKAISFVLAPMYSYYLSTSQYGTINYDNGWTCDAVFMFGYL